MVARCPSATVGDAVGEEVELLRADDRGGSVAKEGLEAGCGGTVVGDDVKARKMTGRRGRGAALVFEVLFGNGRPAEFAGAPGENAQRGANGSSALAVRINVNSIQLRLKERCGGPHRWLRRAPCPGRRRSRCECPRVGLRAARRARLRWRSLSRLRAMDEICRALEMLAQEVRLALGPAISPTRDRVCMVEWATMSMSALS